MGGVNSSCVGVTHRPSSNTNIRRLYVSTKQMYKKRTDFIRLLTSWEIQVNMY